MDLTNKKRRRRLGVAVALTAVVAVLLSCQVKYGFNGASIDFSKTKTIQIADFPIRSRTFSPTIRA